MKTVVMTDQRIFILKNAKFSIFRQRTSYERVITLPSIGYLTISSFSSEFILHIPSEYDLMAKSEEAKDSFILYFLYLREAQGPEYTLMYYHKKNKRPLRNYVKDFDNNAKPLVPACEFKKMTSETFGKRL